MSHFGDRLIEACLERDSRVVLGLDPRVELLPADLAGTDAERVVAFCKGVIEAAAPFCAAAKVQSAFFEELGPQGWDAFAEVCRAAADRGLPVIGDVKRADIGSTSEAYARAWLDRAPCDAVTVQPWMGRDSVEPFLRRCPGKGVFALARTSNPGAAEVQDVEAGGEPLYLRIARMVRGWALPFVGSWGYSSVGIVAGATRPDAIARLREACPELIFLLPGVGAQGASERDAVAAFDRKGLGAVVNASRAILYPGGRDWRRASAEAARGIRDSLRRALGR